jgi:hypothetical protein
VPPETNKVTPGQRPGVRYRTNHNVRRVLDSSPQRNW